MKQLESGDKVVNMLGEWFDKAPALPKGGRDFIAMITPWLALLGGVLLVLVGISALVGGAAFAPAVAMAGSGVAGSLLIAGVISVVMGALYVVAFRYLRAGQAAGWRLLFWGEVLSILSDLIQFHIFSAVLSFLIGFYLLFQIRSYYK